MKNIDVARKVLEDGCQVFRVRKHAETGEYDCKPFFCGNRHGWVALDSFTASAIVAVHDALNEKNRATFCAMPIQKMARVAFKLVKTGGSK